MNFIFSNNLELNLEQRKQRIKTVIGILEGHYIGFIFRDIPKFWVLFSTLPEHTIRD